MKVLINFDKERKILKDYYMKKYSLREENDIDILRNVFDIIYSIDGYNDCLDKLILYNSNNLKLMDDKNINLNLLKSEIKNFYRSVHIILQIIDNLNEFDWSKYNELRITVLKDEWIKTQNLYVIDFLKYHLKNDIFLEIEMNFISLLEKFFLYYKKDENFFGLLLDEIYNDDEINNLERNEKQEQEQEQEQEQDHEEGFSCLLMFSELTNYNSNKEYKNKKKILNIINNESLINKLKRVSGELKNDFTVNYKSIVMNNSDIEYNQFIYEVLKLNFNDENILREIYNQDNDKLKYFNYFINELKNDGINRIVLVEDDINLKNNVEIVKYVPFNVNFTSEDMRATVIDYKNKSLEIKNKIASLSESVIYEKYSKNILNKIIDEFFRFNYKESFVLENISLSELVSKTRFNLYFEMNDEIKNRIIEFIENIDILDNILIDYRDVNILKNEREMLRSIIKDNSSNVRLYDRIEFIKNTNLYQLFLKSKEKYINLFKNDDKVLLNNLDINYININKYFKNSLFIFKNINLNTILSEFRKNRIILSSGLNTKKHLINPIESRFISVLLKIFGNRSHKFVVKSFNKMNPELNKKKLSEDDMSIVKASSFDIKKTFFPNNDENFYNLSKYLNDRLYDDVLKRFQFEDNKESINADFNSIKKKMKDKKIYGIDYKNKRFFRTLAIKNNDDIKQKNINSDSALFKKENEIRNTYLLNSNKVLNIKDNLPVHNTNKKNIYMQNLKRNIFLRKKEFKRNFTSTALNNVNLLKNELIDNKIRTEFLLDNSIFYKNIKEIIENNLSDKELMQKNIEEYCVDFEYTTLKEYFSNINEINKYNPIFRSFKDYTLKNLNNSLEIYSRNYYINNFNLLIKEIKKNNKNCNFLFIYFILIFKYEEIKIKKENNIKRYYNNNDNDTSKEKYIEVNKKVLEKLKKKFLDNEENIVSSIIISILMKIILEEKLDVSKNHIIWGSMTQDKIINKLGEKIIRRLPAEIPYLFLNFCTEWTDEDKNTLKYFYNNLINNITEETKAEIGSTILDIITTKNNNINLFKDDGYIYNNRKKYKAFRINEEYLEFLNNYIFNPGKLPMVVTPKNWKVENYKNLMESGGYFNLDFKKLINDVLIHKNIKNSQKSDISSIQVETINYLNNQKFNINTNMLSFLLKNYYLDENDLFKGLNKKKEFPEINLIKKNETLKRQYSSHNSKWNLYRNILSLAIVLENIEFYIPTYLDFRGRIYTSVDYLTYQGEDLARSLLEFSEGCYLNKDNINYVFEYLANLAGKSKLTLKNKRKWSVDFINNLELITFIDIKNENLDLDNLKKLSGNEKITIESLAIKKNVKDVLYNNEDKFKFLIVLYNLINSLIDRKKKFNTPICFDATCSGFQHLSAIFKDINIAYNANVLPKNRNLIEVSNLDTIEDFPMDIYRTVSDTVKKEIQLLNEDDSNLKNKLNKIDINRKLLKKPVMTVPYNVGLETMQQQLVNDGFFIEKKECFNNSKVRNIKFYKVNNYILKNKEEDVLLTLREMGLFSKILYQSVYITFPNLSKYVKFMNDWAKIFTNLNTHIEWQTPVGMKIRTKYIAFENKPIKSAYNKIRLGSVSLPSLKNNLNKIKNKVAFMPNFIHSMDSANIQFLIFNLINNNKKINLFTIHDCFATTPDSMEFLNKEIRYAFTMIYFEKDYIKLMQKDFLKEVLKYKEIYCQLNEDHSSNEKEDNPMKLKVLINQDIDDPSFNINLNYFIVKSEGENIRTNNRKLKETDKLYIPKLPYNLESWCYFKNIFEEGIKKSIYMVN